MRIRPHSFHPPGKILSAAVISPVTEAVWSGISPSSGGDRHIVYWGLVCPGVLGERLWGLSLGSWMTLKHSVFPQKYSWETPIAPTTWWVWGVYCEFKLASPESRSEAEGYNTESPDNTRVSLTLTNTQLAVPDMRWLMCVIQLFRNDNWHAKVIHCNLPSEVQVMNWVLSKFASNDLPVLQPTISIWQLVHLTLPISIFFEYQFSNCGKLGKYWIKFNGQFANNDEMIQYPR